MTRPSEPTPADCCPMGATVRILHGVRAAEPFYIVEVQVGYEGLTVCHYYDKGARSRAYAHAKALRAALKPVKP
jgi:hypothetical protein